MALSDVNPVPSQSLLSLPQRCECLALGCFWQSSQTWVLGEGLEGGGGGGFLCLFKKQARMSTVTSVQVFGSPVILHSVNVYVGDRHISGAERFETFRGIFRAECLKVEGASATS